MLKLSSKLQKNASLKSFKQIRCAATGGYPAPLVSWSEPAESDIDFTAEPEIVTLTNDHTTNVFHTIQVLH